MATLIYGQVLDNPSWDFEQTVGGAEIQQGMTTVYPFPSPGSVPKNYLNKCVDGVTGQWHLWQTFFPDREGVYYQDSGGQQFDAGTYKVEAIVHGREQN